MPRRSARPRYRIGLRTVKTGTAVMLALLVDSLRPVSYTHLTLPTT